MIWGARVNPPCLEALEYTSSISFDDRIAQDVVRINIAHTLMLVKQGIISPSEGRTLYRALKRMLQGFELRHELEDVHMCLEEAVIREVGINIGGKLHTGKSRNDQVATALRMTAKRYIVNMALELLKLKEVLLDLCSRHVHTVMPGYTHLQHAQPVTLAHYLMAYYEKFRRDYDRLMRAYEVVDACPMGSGALAGSSFSIDRRYVAHLLGFSKIQDNTVDAVSDRDFMIEVGFCSLMIMLHLSQLAEELVLWSTWEYGFAEIPDSYSSTSSIMPQKKNPTVAEVVRARASHVLGMLISALGIIKSLPLSYNLDLQEVTPPIWLSVEETLKALKVMRGVVGGLQFDVRRMHEAAELGFSSATELANELVRRYGIPFRVAHRIVGRVVKEAVDKGLTPSEVTPEMLMRAAKAEGYDLVISEELLRESLDPVKCTLRSKVQGGPSPEEVFKLIDKRRAELEDQFKKILKLEHEVNAIDERLSSEAKLLGVEEG